MVVSLAPVMTNELATDVFLLRSNNVFRQGLIETALSFAIGLCGAATRPFGYRGFYRLTDLLGRVVSADARCQVVLDDDTRFELALTDPYWNRLLFREFIYEPELYFGLRAIADVGYTFIDVGANWGYWSVLVSSKRFGAHDAIAFEPMPRTFKFLRRNSEINGNRFAIHNNAIAPGSPSTRKMSYVENAKISAAGASLVGADKPGRVTVEVATVPLDDVLASHANTPIVLKARH